MTKKQLWTYGGIGVLAIAAFLFLRHGGASASAIVQPSNSDYLNYNIPSGYSGQTSFGPLSGVPALGFNGAPSCGCAGPNGLSNTFFSATDQLLKTYNATIGSVINSAVARLQQAASGTYVP